MQGDLPGEGVPVERSFGVSKSDSGWATLGKLLGLSEPPIPPLQNEVDDDTNIIYLQFERVN